MKAESIRDMLSQAGVEVNGSQPWDIQVRDERWYSRVWRGRSLGLGESYMDGWWDCRQLDEMICRLLRSGIEERVRGNLWYLVRLLPPILFNLQSRARARIIAERHYDLDNQLFLSFLDPHNQYSCGYFERTQDLNEAQLDKLALICAKLNLVATDHVLDIGCGWGGFARYAAEHIGCTVTAVNISKEQLGYARDLCKGLPVHFLDCDYRAIEGRFDKIVSVGMFEHVGRKNYRTFMKVVHRCLKDEGIFLLHTIGGNSSRSGCDPWIAKYIFPNGMLPSVAQIGKAVEGLFVMEDWHNLGPHYDKTLMAWNHNFQRAWPELKKRRDMRFKRMWEYYLLSCAGAFRARNIQVWQIVLTKYGTTQPTCRDHLINQTGGVQEGDEVLNNGPFQYFRHPERRLGRWQDKRSAPAQNESPAPVMIAARMEASSRKSSHAFARAFTVSRSSSFRASGRLIVMQAIWSFFSTSMVMGSSLGGTWAGRSPA